MIKTTKKQNIISLIFVGVFLFQNSLVSAQFEDSYYGSAYDTSWGTTINSDYSSFGTTIIDQPTSWGTTVINPSWGTTIVPDPYASNNTTWWGTTASDPTTSWGTTVQTDNTSWGTTIIPSSAVSPSYVDTTSSWSPVSTTNYPTSYGLGYSSYGASAYLNYPAYSWTGYNYPSTSYVAPPINYSTYSQTTQTIPTSCPSGTSYINGVCQPQVQCPLGTSLVGGTCVVTSTQCPAGTTLIGGICTVNTTTNCPAGSSLINGTCVINTTQCPIGSSLVNGVCTVNTVIPTYTCPNGNVVSYSYLCPPVYTSPGYTYPTYTYPTYNYTTPTTYNYQTCWDGSVIYTTSVCSAQYKVCANGTSIPVYQTCYYGNSYVAYNPPQTVVFNNVVTSVTTQITNNSARCNGIGLIANNVASTGWFEYGETSNLGRQTTSASIGSSASAPFSNILTNLKPSTRYYCRAVMQNQYGTVKGSIVSFTTKSKAVTYVQPVSTVTKEVVKTKEATKKNEIICIDGTIVSTSESSAALLNKGEKLVALQIEKISGDLSVNTFVTYKLSYKNLSDSRLGGVVVTVSAPQEITGITTTKGTYDANTHSITLNQNTLDPYTEGIITWSGKVSKDSPLGKSIVTTAYTLYTVPNTDVQDEVTAYVVGSIVPQNDTSKDNSKNIIGDGEGRGFLPNSLVEWLAFIAIVFIIFILARSIFTSYKQEEK